MRHGLDEETLPRRFRATRPTPSNLCNAQIMPSLGIPMKVVSDSDLIPVTCSEVKAVVFGAKRRWRSYRA
jgi:hypothetical protein